MGRKREYRNAAERQKAYRQRKKQEKLHVEALRYEQAKQEEIRVRGIIRELGFFKWRDVYASRIKQPMPGHVACPCGNLQIPVGTPGANGKVFGCTKCTGTIAGAIRYFERTKQE